MKFDIYSWDLAEVIFQFMEERMDDFCAYCADGNTDISLAEYVAMFHQNEFKQYCENLGYVFQED